MGENAATTANQAVVDNPFGLMAMLQQGDFVTKGVFAILVIMSLLTWFIMIAKYFDQRRLRKQGLEASKDFWTASNLADGAAKLKGTANPFRSLADTGRMASEQHDANKTRIAGAIDASEWITGALQRTADSIIGRMQSGLPILASVGATAPFIGLLGTVWGIYHALIKISLAGQASIDKVAGPVGEALIMTAIGLAVAVPAVLGYNVLLRRNKLIQENVSHFAHELHAYLIAGAKVGGLGARTAGAK
jgi:biopolymer transport protein ExbB